MALQRLAAEAAQGRGRREGSSRGAPSAGCATPALGGCRLLEGPAGERQSRALPTMGLCPTPAAASAVPTLGLPWATACCPRLPPHPPFLLRGFCLIPYAPFLFFFLTEEAGLCI